MSHVRVVILLIALPFAGCDKSDKAPSGETNAAPSEQPVATNGATPEDTAPAKSEPAASEAGWSITIDGVDIPELTGSEVDYSQAEHKYMFKGAPAMVTLTLDAPPPADGGEVTPKSMSFTYTKKRLNCGFTAEDDKTKLTLRYETASKATLDGVVSCGTIGPQGEQILGRVSGSFVRD